ncbi:GTP-binding protein Rho1 [Tulasnella sp. 332]|nr:GTP-binding protein Rho1 [Tulasnella sp. 332]
MTEIRRKLVIVGDGACGKTCLLIVFSKGTFPEVYVPTVFENYVADVEVDGKHVELALWDTAGQEDYDRLRPLSYPDSHVILICFAVDSPDSLDNVQEKWIAEVMHFCQNLPIILVGCKKDLRRDQKTIDELRKTSQRPVTPEEGMAVAQKIGAKHYLECSAKSGEGVREVFQYATRAALLSRTRKSKGSNQDSHPSPSPQPPSPLLEHGHLHLPSSIYYDPRTVPGPSRYVRAPVNATGSAGAVLARCNLSSDTGGGVRCAVAGKDYLKILSVNESEKATSSNLAADQTWAQAQTSHRRRGGSKLLSKGTGNARVYEETSIRLAMNTSSTDVGWGHANFSNKIVVASMSGDILVADHGKSNVKLERTVREHTRSVNGLAFSPYLPNYFATCSQDGYVKLWDWRAPDESYVAYDHKYPTRSVSFCPHPSNPFYAVVGLESGGFFKWDYRRGSHGLLDRVAAAHTSAILGLEWGAGPRDGPGCGSGSEGWLCTGGMDKTVKIWDMSRQLQDRKPVHILHTAERVKAVAWRPEHACEVAVVPTTPGLSARPVSGSEKCFASNPDQIEVWDVRRPWLPKYVLDDGEGAVIQMVWAGPDIIWATYSNGTFVQHDLRHCHRPLDSIPRSALAWDSSGSITYASEPVVAEGDLPYDDIKPDVKTLLVERGWRDKSPSDPEYAPANQTVATVTLPVFDLQAFVDLARGYVLGPHRDDEFGAEPGSAGARDACLINAEVAHRAEQYRAAQTWIVLHSLLKPITPPSLHHLMPTSPPPASPATVSHSTPPVSHLALPHRKFRPADRRHASTSALLYQHNPQPPNTQQHTGRFAHPAKSSDNSPASEGRRRYSSAHAPPTGGVLTRPVISRRSSGATRVSRSSGGRRKGSNGRDSRLTARSRSRGGSHTRSRSGPRASSQLPKHVGDGALDDDSDESDRLISPGTEGSRGSFLGMTVGSPSTTPMSSKFSSQKSPRLLPRYGGHSSNPSLNAKILEAPNEADENGLPSSHPRERTISSSQTSATAADDPFSSDHSDDAGDDADDNYYSSSTSSEGRSSPFRAPAPPSSPIAKALKLERQAITKQDSLSSLKTTVPMRSAHSKRVGMEDSSMKESPPISSGGDTEGKRGFVEDGPSMAGNSTDGDLGGSTRRPSPVRQPSLAVERYHARTRSGTLQGHYPSEATITEVHSPAMQHERLNSSSASQHTSSEYALQYQDGGHSRLSVRTRARDGWPIRANGAISSFGVDEEERRGRHLHRTPALHSSLDPRVIAEKEEQARRVGWAAMKETFEYYSEIGDVQMCTTLANVAKGQILLGEDEGRLERVSDAYIDLLSRHRLHTSAAYVRKYGDPSELKRVTQVNTSMYAACGRCKKPLFNNAALPAPDRLRAPPSDGSSRGGSGDRRRSQSRDPFSAAFQTPSHVIPENKRLKMVEGGYGFCDDCHKTAARCSICRLPVRGLHFACAVCSHGGHHECYRQYYLHRPMIESSSSSNPQKSYGKPGNSGWGLSMLIKDPQEVDKTPDGLHERKDSNASDGIAAPRKDSILQGGTIPPALLGTSWATRPKDRDLPRERESLKNRLMGHPCAAGCGHVCWVANESALTPEPAIP